MSYLAQVNIAKMVAEIDSPIMEDFANNLDRINTLAEASSGFIWRLVANEDNATSIQVFEDTFILVNMSVWKHMEALYQFTYASEHVEIFKRKKEWFHKMTAMHMAFWYVQENHRPTVEEAKKRLAYLQKHGETPYAFTFKSKFTAEDAENFMA
ncbi:MULTISPECIES: DUF3291 domain-containing protein [Cellulophaga]|uniref:DUF3291 domain-containing protein n=1 Tax=Cellulophaga baltica TaxID=76594 RepID=A0A1G7I4E9_9FLAO|nr:MULTISPECIES: DUF3291 domain-containing protein [Cellulophaga]KGK28987.1 hypothetical protein EL45_17125 [Cellulophaga sp. E6(2014)]SDF07611.1 protein of unknown function [Cellulophaga baltica]